MSSPWPDLGSRPSMIRKGGQDGLLEPQGHRRCKPGGDAVARAGVLCDQLFEPSQSLDLSSDEACAARALGAAGGRAVRFKMGFPLVGFGDLLHAAPCRELGQGRQVGRFREM